MMHPEIKHSRMLVIAIVCVVVGDHSAGGTNIYVYESVL